MRELQLLQHTYDPHTPQKSLGFLSARARMQRVQHISISSMGAHHIWRTTFLGRLWPPLPLSSGDPLSSVCLEGALPASLADSLMPDEMDRVPGCSLMQLEMVTSTHCRTVQGAARGGSSGLFSTPGAYFTHTHWWQTPTSNRLHLTVEGVTQPVYLTGQISQVKRTDSCLEPVALHMEIAFLYNA